MDGPIDPNGTLRHRVRVDQGVRTQVDSEPI
jgi:hypothetical protein